MLTLQVPFPPTLSSRLAQRLQDIAMKEKLRTDMTALMALTEKTDNDIRACLSTLQFFKSRGKYMRSVDIHKVNIGQKKGIYIFPGFSSTPTSVFPPSNSSAFPSSNSSTPFVSDFSTVFGQQPSPAGIS